MRALVPSGEAETRNLAARQIPFLSGQEIVSPIWPYVWFGVVVAFLER